jgi:hypothetical protein
MSSLPVNVLCYHTVPASRVQHCPAKRFDLERDTIQHAVNCAQHFGLAYAVWAILRGGKIVSVL